MVSKTKKISGQKLPEMFDDLSNDKFQKLSTKQKTICFLELVKLMFCPYFLNNGMNMFGSLSEFQLFNLRLNVVP